MLPCVCQVIEYRWRQNMTRIKKWRLRSRRECYRCSHYILIYYFTDPRQHGFSLSYMIKMQNNVNGDSIYTSFIQVLINENQLNCVYNSPYHIIKKTFHTPPTLPPSSSLQSSQGSIICVVFLSDTRSTRRRLLGQRLTARDQAFSIYLGENVSTDCAAPVDSFVRKCLIAVF